MRRTYTSLLLMALWVGVAGALLVPASDIRFDNDTWLPETHPGEIARDYVAREFAPGEGLILALDTPDGFFTRAVMSATETYESLFDKVLARDLISIRSPLSATEIIDNDGTLEIRGFKSLLDDGVFADMEDYAQAFSQSPYAGKLLSEDAHLTALRLRLGTREQSPRRARAIDKIHETLEAQGLTSAAHLIGEAVIKDALNRKSQSTMPVFILLVGVMVAVFLYVFLGSLARALPVFLAALAAIAGTFACIVVLGHTMNVIALALPVLVCVIAVANGLHILARRDYLGARDNAFDTSLAHKTIARTWVPCFFATATSATGFGAFSTSAVIPLYHFGIDSVAAILFAFPIIIFTLWGALYIFGARAAPPSRRWHPDAFVAPFIGFCHRQTTLHRRRSVALFLVLGVLGALGLLRAHTETNFLSVFFREDSTIRQDFNLADRQLGGSGGIDVILKSSKIERFKERDAFDTVRRLARRLPDHKYINHAESYALPVKRVHRELTGEAGVPDTDALLAQEITFLEFSRSEAKDDVLSPYTDFNYEAARIYLRTPDLPSGELAGLIAWLDGELAELRDDFEIVLTGFGVFIHTMSLEVLETQIESFALTLALIAVLFLLLFGPSLGFAGILANLVPVGGTIGLIAWLGVPFNFATILIAGVTLGLCVDDTIHFLHAYRHARARMEPDEARREALLLTGWPIILTSVLFCLGFSVLLASELVILTTFALFSMFGLGAALVSTLLFLPALLALGARTKARVAF